MSRRRASRGGDCRDGVSRRRASRRECPFTYTFIWVEMQQEKVDGRLKDGGRTVEGGLGEGGLLHLHIHLVSWRRDKKQRVGLSALRAPKKSVPPWGGTLLESYCFLIKPDGKTVLTSIGLTVARSVGRKSPKQSGKCKSHIIPL